ncbi:serine/threonine-protein kinase [Streptomyces sp. MST-110588]|uniref:serine/threonine-protein kinase n=1 Tax=Streptomyces sp. MST-110588 TaxID=2833628 RepID=UPI001F5D4B14|nr:serine/threonine-protein kinase [Streptomyces sp. MST-110588]UNO40973.1 serine/threonine protein kinase [Streptomyces sp. MST-110588]
MGEVFAGRYELIDPIGRGGVGAVWRAWDGRRRRYVAAKVLQQSDAHALLRFVREQALRIDHPHVLAPASWAADDDKVLFTMDLVNGGSLAHLVGDYGPLPPRFVCTLLDQLLAGLTAVHAEGVVHRDIKPANILLEATGTGRPHLRLSDFGISMRKGEPRLTEANYVVGTPGYFAPEQLTGAEPDFPADLFAVGLVALYLLTGNKPDTQALVRHFEEHGTPDAPQDVPEPLWQVLANLLQPDPEARFKTATGARKALLSAAELLPEVTIEEEAVEVFDHIGPLPAGFGPDGPVAPAPREAEGEAEAEAEGGSGAGVPGAEARTGSGAGGGPVSPVSSASGASTGMGMGTGTGAGSTSGVVVPERPGTPPPPAPPSTPPGPVPAPAPVPASASAARPSSPPPPPVPVAPPAAAPAPGRPVSPYEATAAIRRDPARTRPYTAGRPPQATATPAAPATGAAAAVRRPGPPPKVAVPVLVVALLCIALGVWALAGG